MGTRNRERRKVKRKGEKQRQQRAAQAQGSHPPFDAYRHPQQAEAAESLVGAAVLARQRGDVLQSQRCQRALTEGLDGPGGRRVVDLALLGCLQRWLALGWRHGWQPADVVRLARRTHGARHSRMTVDLVAAQLRQYAAATVDELWHAQLRAMEAEVWWPRDDQYLHLWGEREGTDRAEVVECAVELLVMLDRLPPLPMLCPPPGSAGRGGAGGPRAASWAGDQRMLDRVRALLAKAESTGFPEEAEAFTAKAQELMARHSIDHALLAASTAAAEEPAGRRIGIDNPYEAPKALLLDAVASANACRAVWSKDFGFATVMGYPTDLDAVELLYTSLLVQATTAIVHAGTRRDRYGRSSTRSFRQSFLTAYAQRIGERLRGATENVSREARRQPGAAANLLPVLAARDDAVRGAFETMFPALSTRTVAVSNLEGWASGRASADRASLGPSQALPGTG